MTVILDKVRVQNALVAAAMAGTFYSVTYDPTTHLAALGAAEVPGEALANETGSQFSDAKLNRRSGMRERSSWTFELLLKFAKEVALEAFETSLVRAPIKLLRDVNQVQGMRQITLELTQSVPIHPVQQDPSTGTRVVYTFQARMTPA